MNVKTLRLNTQMFYDYQRIIPEIRDDNEIVINIGGDLEDYIQDAYLEIAAFDEDNDTITYYGTEDCCEYDGEGNIVVGLDGKWFALDGVFLDAEFSFGTETTSTYITKVIHNITPSYMSFTLNDETGEIDINSVVKIPTEEDPDFASTFKTNTELLPGDTIIPIINVQDASGQKSSESHGKVSGLELNPEFIGTGN